MKQWGVVVGHVQKRLARLIDSPGHNLELHTQFNRSKWMCITINMIKINSCTMFLYFFYPFDKNKFMQ